MKSLTLADIMTRKVVEVDPAAPLVDAAALMECAQISSLLVVQHGMPIGVLTERDILRAYHRAIPTLTPVEAVMSRPVVGAAEDTPIFDGYHLLAQRNIRHLMVTNGAGRATGIVSQSDFRFHLGLELLGRLRDIRSLMSMHVPILLPGATVSDAVGLMERDQTTCAIIARDMRPIGMVTERDVTRLYRQECNGTTTPITDVMTRPVETLSASAAPQVAMERMQALRMRHLVIVDDGGLIVGLLTERHLVGHLDELYIEHMLQAMKQAEASLALSEARWRAVWEQVADPMFLLSPDGGLLECNPAAANLVREEPGKLVGKVYWDTPWWSHSAELRRRVQQAVFHTVAHGVDGFGAVHPAGDGAVRQLDYSFQPIRNSEGRVVMLMVRGEDVTDERRVEEDLRLAASVFAHTHEGIVITDPQGRIVAVNKAFTMLTGYSEQESVGRNIAFLKSGHQDASFYHRLWQTLERDGHWHGEVWNRSKNGDLLAELLTISAVNDPHHVTTHYVGVFSDITALKENQEELERLAHYDALTGLSNRVLLADRMRHALAGARRRSLLLAVCYLDLDGFKPVNDALGHSTGDRLLVEIAKRLASCVRGDDTVARLGGDEFVILLGDAGSLAEVRQIASRVLTVISQPLRIDGNDVSVSGSLGIALFPQDGDSCDALTRNADAAMYAAKQAGRNNFRMYGELMVST